MTYTAFIALGANLGEPAKTFQRALRLIADRVGPVLQQSSWHTTDPVVLPGDDPKAHPQFLNGAIQVATELEPEELLSHLLAIEAELGRHRIPGERWQPRIIDLDIIAIDSLTIESPALVIPHPQMHTRLFVLEPLLEIAPDWRHPVLQRSVSELRQSVLDSTP